MPQVFTSIIFLVDALTAGFTPVPPEWLKPLLPRPIDCQEEARASNKNPGMTIKIPVKPYIRKFLGFYLGENYTLRQDDPFGLILFVLLQKNTTKGRNAKSLSRYTSTWEVDVCENRLRKNGYKGLTNLTIVHFSNFVEGICKMEFHTAAALYHRHKVGTIETAIREFMEKFNMTADDIDPTTLRRSFNRYRRDNIDRDKLQHRRYKLREPKIEI